MKNLTQAELEARLSLCGYETAQARGWHNSAPNSGELVVRPKRATSASAQDRCVLRIEIAKGRVYQALATPAGRSLSGVEKGNLLWAVGQPSSPRPWGGDLTSLWVGA